MLLHAILTRLIRHGRLTVRFPDGQERRYEGGPGPEAAMAIATTKDRL